MTVTLTFASSSIPNSVSVFRSVRTFPLMSSLSLSIGMPVAVDRLCLRVRIVELSGVSERVWLIWEPRRDLMVTFAIDRD